jgi:RHS repeat-associated protein
MEKIVYWSRTKRLFGRGSRCLAVALALTVLMSVGLPDGDPNVFAGPDFSWAGIVAAVGSWLRVPHAWAAPDTPKQRSGTAVGRRHTVSSSATRAGGGMGRPPGKGRGELSAYAPSARKARPGQSAKTRRGFDKATSVRVPAKSTATSTYYSNADGSYTREFRQGPVNYRDGSGGWQPIDTTVHKGGDGRWREAANSVEVAFAGFADAPDVVSVRPDATHAVSQHLVGAAHVAGVASGSTVSFPGLLPGTDLKLLAMPTGQKEELVLHDADAPSSWSFDLNLAGLTAAKLPSGAIGLSDHAGKPVLTIPAGYAYDSAVDRVTGEPATTHSVSYELVRTGGHTRLNVTLDPAWLRDPARVFPVTVDPSYGNHGLTTYAATGDGYTGDRSGENVIKIGSYDSGVNAARSFIMFPSFGIDNSNVNVTAASLDLFDTWATVCTPERFDVAPVTQPWTPSNVTTYPGPTLGASIGNLTPSVPNACANTGADRSVGDWVTVPLSVATFNSWAKGTSPDYGLGVYAATNNTLTWKQFASVMSQQGGPNLHLTYDGYLLPALLTQNPSNGAQVGTLTPTLSAEGTVDGNLGVTTKFDYQVFDAAGVKLADSGLVTGAYAVPAGKLRWGQTYSWTVQVFDGTNYSPNPQWFQFTAQVPQPAVTSTLSQNPGHGFEPSIGNYTTSATDANVATAGPALSVARSYNSRDPRTTGAFGAAWATVYDAKAEERYDPSGAVSTVVVTYPDGSDVAYGRNADGTFTAPAGRASTLIRLPNGYELIDKSVTTYAFTQPLGTGRYGLATITDSSGRAETFTWASGQITTATSAVSGRALHFTWSTPSGASAAHVATVTTDPATAGQPATAYTWTYGYTGDKLTSVCPPGSTTACTRYGYVANAASQTRNQVLDKGAHSYWPLAETSGTQAASAVLANEGVDNATYANVTLGSTVGPLASSPVTGATFNGTSSLVKLPDLRMSSSIAQSVSMWFKADAGTPAGVLFSYSDMPISATAKQGNSMPTIYLGTDGKLLGEYWISSTTYAANPIVTSTSVADGRWHQVVLTGSQSQQAMYVDGALVGTIAGWGTLGLANTAPWQWHSNYLGTGFLGPSVDGNGVWPDQPHTALDTLYASYFKGSIADAAFYEGKVLTAADATALYQAGTRPGILMTSATRPSGKAYASINYDTVSATVMHVTDENNGSWNLAAPAVSGSSQVYRAAVLGSGPTAYYRLGDAAGSSSAYSDVHYAPGTYGNVTLGSAGRFPDNPAASFNGTSSNLRVPQELLAGGASSQELWFSTKSTGGVLLSSQNSAVGGTTCPCLPAMWITSDGKLRALSPSTTPTGPFTAKSLANKCIDDALSKTTNGNPVQIYTCNGGAAQNATMYPDGTIRILGKCLDLYANGTTNGTKVELWDCTGAPNQVWQPYNGGLRNPVSGRCLDDPLSSTTNGTQLQLYDCNGGAAQTWLQSLASPVPVNDGEWHHAVLTSTGTAQSLYVDGTLAQSTTGSVALTPGPQPYAYVGAGYTGPAAIGSPDTGLPAAVTSYFTGSIGEVAFYRTALTGAEAATHFGAARNSNGIVPMTTVTVTDPGGKALKYQYDTINNRMIAKVDGPGNKASYGYDTSGFLYTTTDPNGNVTKTGHDAAGNVVSTVTCQNQAANVCSTAYATYKANSMGADAAKGGAVTASSSYVGGGWKPAALTDGNVASVSDSLGWTSAAQTSATSAQWVQVDLGSASLIDQVALYARTDGVGGFPSAFNIQVSANGTTWTTVTTQTNYPAPTIGIPAVFGFTPTSARYVKVTGTTLRTDGSNYYMQFAELTATSDRPDPTAGQLLTQRDARSASATDNAYLTTYSYDPQGNPTGVTTPPVAGFPNGRTSTIAYTDGTTVAAADGGFAPAGLPYRTTSAGNAVNTISYFHLGSVASTTDADGLVTRYGYDNLGRVTSKTLVSDTFPAGLVTTYAYDGQDQVVSETAPPITDRITGAVHTARTTTVYDDDGDLTSQTVADTTGGDAPRTHSISYDAYDRVASKTDAELKTTTFGYDGYGNKVSETDPLGTTMNYTFDPNGRPLTQVIANYTGDPANPQPAGPLTEISKAYDPAGRLASVTNAMGNTTSYTYTDDGLLATATRTDSAGKNPYVEKDDRYDAADNLVTEIANNGATTTVYTVDAASRQAAITVDPSGVNRTSTITYTADDGVATNASSDGTGVTITTSGTYSPMGRTTSKSVTSNTPGYTGTLATSWQLDQRGLPTSQTNPNGNVTSLSYDEAGRLAVTVLPTVDVESGGGATTAIHPLTRRGFDTFGDQVEAQDANDNVAVTGYDANGRAVSQTLPNYTPPGSSTPITAVKLNAYDAIGNLIQVTDPLLKVTKYEYDQLGDVAQVTAPDGGKTHSTFDTNGETLSVTDPTGAQAQATYDHLGRRLTTTAIERFPSTAAHTTTNSYAASADNPDGAWLASSTSPTGVVTSYKYNNAGETTAVTDGAGNTTGYRYDLLGRRAAVVAPDGTSATVAFDQAGNVVTEQNRDAAGAVLTTRSAVYDSNGNLRSSTDARGHTSTFTYDPTNALTKEVQPVTDTSSITTSFGRDAAGNRTRFTDGRGNSWIYTYNSWNLPESVIEPATPTYGGMADRTTTTTYDARGQATAQTLPGGVTISRTYDAVGKLRTQAGSGAEAETATRRFDYDLAGRITSAATDAAGGAAASSETFTYDDRGDLLTAAGSGGDSGFAYNGDGSMTSRTDAAGTTNYTHDTAGRLKTIADPVTNTLLALTYNSLSQVATIQYGAGGNARTFGYDPLHRLTSDVLKTPGDATVASIGYGYDENGNETSKTTVGFSGATANTYTYDQADRLTNWNNGTTTVNYGYDESGNRTQVGADVYTYDARDELTGDGKNTYAYTARGTRSAQNGTAATSDAFGQAIGQGSQTYAYDALGRALTGTTAGNTFRFSYSGVGNTPASDGSNTYSRDPGGALIGIGAVGGTAADARLAWTDRHTDIVGDFTATGATLSGSTAYDPLGNVLSSVAPAGHLGYQSGWTDPADGKVNMAARWYSPEVGQFTNKDTVAQDPVPNSANANPFAYVDDDPLTGTDPSGHGLLSWASSAWNATKSFASSAWNATKSVASSIWNATKSVASSAWNWAKSNFPVVNKIVDSFNRELKRLQDEIRRMESQFRAFNNEIRRSASQAAHAVGTAYHMTANGVKTATTYVKNHAGAIATFVVSTAVFIGCEAVLGAATGGVGAVVGATACGALSGAVGGLVDQGIKCAEHGKADCSAGAFLKAGVIGGVVGGVAGLGGVLGGKLLAAVGGRALRAVGGLFGRGGGEAAEGAASGAAEGAVSGAAEGATEGAASGAAEGTAEGASESAVNSAAEEAGQAGRGAQETPGRGGSRAGRESESPSCSSSVPHSFVGATPVLMAGGGMKTIDHVRVGDRVANSVPGEDGTRTHTVEKVIVTTTDHDFVDVTVVPVDAKSAGAGGGDRSGGSVGPVNSDRSGGSGQRSAGVVRRGALALVAGVTVLASAGVATLTTTFHHPFYDRTQAAFVEAKDLRVGDELQTPTGTAAITAVRLWHTSAVTYDLTIDGLHTYYVLAGNEPVLVHNCGGPTEVDAKLARDRAEGLQGLRDDYPNAANHGTTSVIGVYNKTTKQWTNHIAINGDGAMPSGWTLGPGEKFVQGAGHAEETILNNLGADEVVGFGGTSRNICRDTCYRMLNGNGMRFGGAGYFGGLADKTPFSYFWQEGW